MKSVIETRRRAIGGRGSREGNKRPTLTSSTQYRARSLCYLDPHAKDSLRMLLTDPTRRDRNGTKEGAKLSSETDPLLPDPNESSRFLRVDEPDA